MIENRLAIITGGAGFLGAEQAAALVTDEIDVLLIDAEQSRLDAAKDVIALRVPDGRGRVSVLAEDVASPCLIDRLKQLHPNGCDILVNNVGYVIVKPINHLSRDEFERQQQVNAHAAFYLAQALSPSMAAKGWGRIINIGSTTLDGMFGNFASYVMSKGALLGLTRALARELGPCGITVNFVSPGALESPAERAAWGDGWARFDEQVKSAQSIKRRGGAKDIANAVRFLCREDSGFISGQQLRVDGGWVMA